MSFRKPFLSIIVLALAALFLLGTLFVTAQGDIAASDVACRPVLDALWETASSACIGKPTGYICNGGSAPVAEPAGPVSSALGPVGALVEVKVVDSVHTPGIVAAGSGGGILWLRVSDFVQLTGLAIGDVTLTDATPPDFPAWQSIIVQTNYQPPECSAAPQSLFVIQSPYAQSTRVVVNGTSLDLSGTVVVQTIDNRTVFTVIYGQLRLLAMGQVQSPLAGQAVGVPYNPGDFSTPAGPPEPPQPLDFAAIQNLPVALLDRPVMLPQPGYVSTQGPVNVRATPSTDSLILFQAPAGSNMTVLGRNTAGDWYHVQFENGETGWMYGELLVKNTGTIQAVYEATPTLPQRYGQLGVMARVNAPLGVNLRSEPDVTYGVVTTLPFGTEVNLLARSPYGPWVKVEYQGTNGWVAMLALDSNAVADALPVDYNVPPPPGPTTVPGTWGNAFPDPQGGGG